MVGWMPILRRESVVEATQQPVDDRNDAVPVGHRQFPARHEGGLDIDQPKDFRSGVNLHLQLSLFMTAVPV